MRARIRDGVTAIFGRRKSAYEEFEKSIGYRFARKSRLEAALTHRSFRFENKGVTTDNQRLEFLGDAILGFIIAEHLYRKFSGRDEGFLTTLRSQTTSGTALAEIAMEIGLGAHMRMGKGEALSGGRERPSNLADALEAVIGAAYFDGGAKAVQKIFKRLFAPRIERLSGDVWADNPKGKLQEYSQRRWKSSPTYRLLHRHGPPHAAVFTVEVVAPDGASAVGKGQNKREAETQAAKNILRHFAHHEAV